MPFERRMYARTDVQWTRPRASDRSSRNHKSRIELRNWSQFLQTRRMALSRVVSTRTRSPLLCVQQPKTTYTICRKLKCCRTIVAISKGNTLNGSFSFSDNLSRSLPCSCSISCKGLAGAQTDSSIRPASSLGVADVFLAKI